MDKSIKMMADRILSQGNRCIMSHSRHTKKKFSIQKQAPTNHMVVGVNLLLKVALIVTWLLDKLVGPSVGQIPMTFCIKVPIK